MRGNSHVRCGVGENPAITSKDYLSLLIYNDPLAYAELILNGDPELYLKAVTKKTPLD